MQLRAAFVSAVCLVACSGSAAGSSQGSATAAPPSPFSPLGEAPAWFYRVAGDGPSVYRSVAWRDGSIGPTLTAPTYTGDSRATIVPSPDGRFLLAQQHDGTDQVIDWAAHKFARFQNRGAFHWSDDGDHVCTTLDTASGGAQLGLRDILTGMTRPVAVVQRAAQGTAIEPIACSVRSDVALTAEEVSSPRGPLVSRIGAFRLSSGERIAVYDYSAEKAAFVVAAPDGHAFAVSDRTHATAAMIRDARTGRTLQTIQDRWVIAVGSGDSGFVAVGQADNADPLVEARNGAGRVTWATTGVVDSIFVSPVASGFALLVFPHGPGSPAQCVFVGADGSARILASNAQAA